VIIVEGKEGMDLVKFQMKDPITTENIKNFYEKWRKKELKRFFKSDTEEVDEDEKKWPRPKVPFCFMR